MNDDRMKELVKRCFEGPPELDRDLWPQMLRRMEGRATVVPWFDWALLALVALGLLLMPNTIPVLLYHL